MTTAFVEAYECLQKRALRSYKQADLVVFETALDLLLRHPDCEGDALTLVHNVIREARRFHKRRTAKAKINPSDLTREAETIADANPTVSDFTAVVAGDWIDTAPLAPRERHMLHLMVHAQSRSAMAAQLKIKPKSLKVAVNRMRLHAQRHWTAAA